MKDFTTNNYCDFLWVNDLLELKKNSRNYFEGVIKRKNKSTSINFSHVIIFGTIVEIKQIGTNGFLYHVDDGTGVIVCKHTADQFDEVLSMIEGEQCDVLNQSVQYRGNNSEQSNLTEYSMEDSIFNNNSVQMDEIEIHKKSQLQELSSLWGDIYQSFANLIYHYTIGDDVLIMGKLYNYFNVNQIYVNSIRLLSLEEKLRKISVKLEDGYEPLVDLRSNLTQELGSAHEKRFSGLMTFDHIQNMNPKTSSIPVVTTPKVAPIREENEIKIPTPSLESTITFDTFLGSR